MATTKKRLRKREAIVEAFETLTPEGQYEDVSTRSVRDYLRKYYTFTASSSYISEVRSSLMAARLNREAEEEKEEPDHMPADSSVETASLVYIVRTLRQMLKMVRRDELVQLIDELA